VNPVSQEQLLLAALIKSWTWFENATEGGRTWWFENATEVNFYIGSLYQSKGGIPL
jgi:hypothetical protein